MLKAQIITGFLSALLLLLALVGCIGDPKVIALSKDSDTCAGCDASNSNDSMLNVGEVTAGSDQFLAQLNTLTCSSGMTTKTRVSFPAEYSIAPIVMSTCFYGSALYKGNDEAELRFDLDDGGKSGWTMFLTPPVGIGTQQVAPFLGRGGVHVVFSLKASSVPAYVKEFYSSWKGEVYFTEVELKLGGRISGSMAIHVSNRVSGDGAREMFVEATFSGTLTD